MSEPETDRILLSSTQFASAVSSYDPNNFYLTVPSGANTESMFEGCKNIKDEDVENEPLKDLFDTIGKALRDFIDWLF